MAVFGLAQAQWLQREAVESFVGCLRDGRDVWLVITELWLRRFLAIAWQAIVEGPPGGGGERRGFSQGIKY